MEDSRTEYVAPILSISTVPGLDEAIERINTFGSQHTDAIVTENYTGRGVFCARWTPAR